MEISQLCNFEEADITFCMENVEATGGDVGGSFCQRSERTTGDEEGILVAGEEAKGRFITKS